MPDLYGPHKRSETNSINYNMMNNINNNSPASTLPRSAKKRGKLQFQSPLSSVIGTTSAREISSEVTSTTTTTVIEAPSSSTGPSCPVPGPTSQQQNRSFIRICQKARRIRFFRNGDQYFKGIWYAISAERFRSFDALLEDLTRSMVDLINLPHGVHCIFSLDGSRKVTDLEQFRDGESYVCTSADNYKRIDYEKAREPFWAYAFPKNNDHLAAAAMSLDAHSSYQAIQECTDFVRPKIVTIIRNGVKPRRVVRLLLNKRTARTFDQVLADITSAVKLDSGVVRKLFTLDGHLVSNLADFFTEDDVFVAYGTEKTSSDDFFLDCEEYKFLYSAKARSTRSAKSPRLMRRFQQRFGAENASPMLRRRFLQQRNQVLLRPKQQQQPKDSPTSRKRRDQKRSSGTGTKNDQQTIGESENVRRHPLEIEDRFVIGRLLGDGNFAVVHECICKRTNKLTALKIINKANCTGKEALVDNEVAILRRLNHKNVVKLYDVFDFDHAFYLSMEHVPGGDLFEALCLASKYEETEAAHIMQNLISALDYLHRNSIVHRDVKPENLLLYQSEDGKKQLKLADFGLATRADRSLHVVCGTPTYVAPEILAELGYGTKVDIWASGVIMYVMLCGFPPFQSMQGCQEELFEQILKGQLTFPSPCWDGVSAAAKGLIQGMLQLDPDDRYSAEELLIHPWIMGCAKVDPEYEELASIAVQSQIRSNDLTDSQPSRSFFDDSNVGYYYSRRRSMDDLSVALSQNEDSDCDLSFEYCDHLNGQNNTNNTNSNHMQNNAASSQIQKEQGKS